MKTKMAIVYDFDGTLAPGNMQERSFIPDLNITAEEFWIKVNKEAKEQNADKILSYMYCMLEEAKAKKVKIRKEDFVKHGKAIKLFEGVEDWFTRINGYGKKKGIDIKHYIVSSGLKEMIEGTVIKKEFDKIYASSFIYDQHNIASWPALAINYTTKTQYLFRINKGSFDVWDDSKINKFVPDKDRHIPFTNIIFIGDGETDIPCMRLVSYLGGYSIAVYKPNTKGSRNKAAQLVKEGRALFIAPADYRIDTDIDKGVKAVIDKVEAGSKIQRLGDSS